MPPAPAVVRPASATPTPAPTATRRRFAGPRRVGFPVPRRPRRRSRPPVARPGRPRVDVREAGAMPREPVRVRHPQRPERPHDRGQPPGTSRSRSSGPRASGSGRSWSSRAGRAAAASRSPTRTRTTIPPDRRALRLRLPGPARHRPLAPHRLPGRDRRLLHELVDPPIRPRARPPARPPSRTPTACIAEAEDPRGRAPAVRDDAGGRGPRGRSATTWASTSSTSTARATAPSSSRRMRRRIPSTSGRCTSTAGRPDARRRRPSTARPPAPSTTRSSRPSTVCAARPAVPRRLRGPVAAGGL